MYSLMSMRTSASSESNMTFASALQSSVLPTPVGPRKQSAAVGFVGSLSPARERCTASATSCTASSCPITWRRSSSSRCRMRSRSESSILATGTPVQLLTTPAMSSAVTSSRSMRSPPGRASSSSSCACSRGSSWNLSSAARFRS